MLKVIYNTEKNLKVVNISLTLNYIYWMFQKFRLCLIKVLYKYNYKCRSYLIVHTYIGKMRIMRVSICVWMSYMSSLLRMCQISKVPPCKVVNNCICITFRLSKPIVVSQIFHYYVTYPKDHLPNFSKLQFY